MKFKHLKMGVKRDKSSDSSPTLLQTMLVESGATYYVLADRTGIPRSTLERLVKNERINRGALIYQTLQEIIKEKKDKD